LRVEVHGNAYSVPWRLIGERVRVTVRGQTIRIMDGAHKVPGHAELKGRHRCKVDDRSLAGLIGTVERPVHRGCAERGPNPLVSTLLRPLTE